MHHIPTTTLVRNILHWQSSILNRMRRTSLYLQHPIFSMHHSESEMMRYIKSLENKDLSLTHSMIPLGSCTMKLNAATELMPVSWREFADLHPFAPLKQAEGYHQIFRELESALCQITGLAAASLQPNSGAQGEFTGLLVIRAYHAERGEAHQKRCTHSFVGAWDKSSQRNDGRIKGCRRCMR